MLWHPIAVSAIFVACYAAFLAYRYWYENHPLPLSRRSVETLWQWNTPGRWLLLGAAMYLVVLAGSLTGLVACAAGLAVTAWILAYRQVMGSVWKIYLYFLWPLVPACIVPPLLGWPAPNIFATLFLTSLGATMAAISALDHLHYANQIKRYGGEPA